MENVKYKLVDVTMRVWCITAPPTSFNNFGLQFVVSNFKSNAKVSTKLVKSDHNSNMCWNSYLIRAVY